MGRWAGCCLRGSHSHLVWGLRRVETNPSAAFGVEVEQGAARKADDKLMGGARMSRRRRGEKMRGRNFKIR